MTYPLKKQPIPFGKYLLLDRINIGGMAEVWRGKSFGAGGFERLVAIKRILPNIAEDEEFISMFIDEAKISVQLTHANVAQIHELGQIANNYFIAMEYIPGKDMRAIFDRGRKKSEPAPIPLVCYVIAKLCEGLDYAHRKKDGLGREMNIVHRDVSPQNVLVSYEGEVKVIDFGIAKAAGKATKTQAGILKGKFGYMSPEQIRGLPLDRRSDVFAIGVCLYEMLTGERLFVGDSDFSVLEKVRKAEVRAPSTHNVRIPEALERIVLKALAKDVEQRYQYASEVGEDLQRFLITSEAIFSRKDLVQYMKTSFAEEVEREKVRLAEYSEIKAPEGFLYGSDALHPARRTPMPAGELRPVPTPAPGSELRPALTPPSRRGSSQPSLPKVSVAADKEGDGATLLVDRDSLAGDTSLSPHGSGGRDYKSTMPVLSAQSPGGNEKTYLSGRAGQGEQTSTERPRASGSTLSPGVTLTEARTELSGGRGGDPGNEVSRLDSGNVSAASTPTGLDHQPPTYPTDDGSGEPKTSPSLSITGPALASTHQSSEFTPVVSEFREPAPRLSRRGRVPAVVSLTEENLLSQIRGSLASLPFLGRTPVGAVWIAAFAFLSIVITVGAIVFRARPGYVLLDVPVEARAHVEVNVNGEEIPTPRSFPVLLKARVGKGFILVKAPGYSDYMVPLTVKDGDAPTHLTARMQRLEQGAKLVVSTDPEGAQILLDADEVRSAGNSEFYIGELSLNVAHTLEVSAVGYRTTTRKFTPRDAKSPITLSIKLESADLVVRVKSHPTGAGVYLGEHALGVTPATVKIPPGVSILTVKRRCYADGQLPVRGDETSAPPVLEVDLRRIPGCR